MPKIAELRATRGNLIKSLSTLDGDKEAFEKVEAEIQTLGEQIERALRAQELAASLARPVGTGEFEAANDVTHLAPPVPERDYAGAGRAVSGAQVRSFNRCVAQARAALNFQPDPARHFRTFGEQLLAVARDALEGRSGTRKTTDERLIRAPSGASEVDPTGGGFLVQTDFAQGIFMLAHEMGDILGAVNKIPISAESNGLKIRGVDETSRATGSRWGGVQTFYVGEGTAVTPTKPKFRLIEFDLKKLMSVMYTTDELLQDSTALSAIAGQAFSEEIMFTVEDAIWEGTGAGLPLGIINSPALVTVAKQNGQVAQTIVKENIDQMWARCWARSRKNAAWFMNQDCEPQLAALNGAVGTGGQLVYMPPGGLSAAPYATLYGRPIYLVEYAAALGTPGDIVLADFSQYTLVDKGGIQMAQSMHVAFLTDEMVFRITYRHDGKPMWTTPLTPFKGSLTKSPFVALAQR